MGDTRYDGREVHPVSEKAVTKLGTLLGLYMVVPGEKAADHMAVRPTSPRVRVLGFGLAGPFVRLALQRGGREVENGHAASLDHLRERLLFSPHSGWETRRRSLGGASRRISAARACLVLVHPLPWALLPTYGLIAPLPSPTISDMYLHKNREAWFAGRDAALKQYTSTCFISPLGHRAGESTLEDQGAWVHAPRKCRAP